MDELLYGIHPVREALIARRRKIKKLYIAETRQQKAIESIVEHAQAAGIAIDQRPLKNFPSQLQDESCQGVAADVGPLPFSDEQSILERAFALGEKPLILAIDMLTDPHNLGALARTALAMGFHGIVLPKANCAPLSPAVSKSSAGAIEHILVARVSNLVSALESFKGDDTWVVGTCAEADSWVDDVDFNTGTILVIGGEHKGLRPLVRRVCDMVVAIPQKTIISSLNASVAGGIIMYEIARQRKNHNATGKAHKTCRDGANTTK